MEVIVLERPAQVVVVSAPAGYGKHALVRALFGRVVSCDLAGARDGDLARAVLDALVARDGPRAARSAADRLAQHRAPAPATSREALRREWSRAAEPEAVVLRDAAGVLASPAGLDLIGELIAALPPQRTLVLVTRAPLAPALERAVAGVVARTVAREDLALSPDAVAALARAHGCDDSVAAQLVRAARGWPLVAHLLARIAGEPAVLDEAARLDGDALLAYAVHRTFVALDDGARDALAVAAVLGGASHDDLVAVLGAACDDARFRRVRDLPFAVGSDPGRLVVHPDVRGLMHARFAPLVREIRERTLAALVGAGRYAQASAVALDAGDAERAAAILDAIPPYTAAPAPLADYQRAIERLDRALVTSYPNVWLATIPYRAFAVDRATYVREAETVAYCLAPGASPELRAGVLAHVASAYANVGRIGECDRLIDDALAGFAREPSAARASVLHLAASLRGMEGRFARARALAEEAASISRDRFGERLALQYIDLHEAAFRGEHARCTVIADELLRRTARDELPLYRAYVAMNGALPAWTYGDDAALARYLLALDDALTPGLERGFGPMLDAARGRPVALDDAYPWPVTAAVAHLYRMGEASLAEDALDAARAAARFADVRGDPFVQVLAHLAVHVLDPAARDDETRVLDAVLDGVESPALIDAVRGIVRGRDPGILAPFLHRRVLRERARRAPQIVVELLAGRVLRDGAPVALREKELELVVLLASARAWLTRERIGEALWEHLDPEEWPNNLKVTLSRLRTKLGLRDAVLVREGNYRLAPEIDVDLWRAEALVRELRGEPLDGAARDALRAILTAYRGGAAARYERFAWMQAWAVRIRDLVCTTGVALAGDALATGAPDAALDYAREVAQIDPFDEAACEVAMRALIARDDPGGARRELDRYAAQLARELDARPSARLTTLLRAG